jgi:hypothetical protein
MGYQRAFVECPRLRSDGLGFGLLDWASSVVSAEGEEVAGLGLVIIRATDSNAR